MGFIKSIISKILYQPLFNALIFLVWLMPYHNIGIAIIILTIILRIILLPSSAKSIVAQKQMQALQPELDKIKALHKDNREAQSKATMDLYQRNKINPLGGCLPLLIQLPILIVLYYVFRSGLDTSHFNLLYSFMPKPEYMNDIFLGIKLSNPSIYLAVVAGLLQFWQSKQMAPKKPINAAGKADKSTQLQGMITNQFTYIMPVFTIMIAMRLPAALALYWSVTSLFSIAQQWWFARKPLAKSGVQITIKGKDDK